MTKTRRKTIFQKTMGSSPRIKILEYFLEWQNIPVCASDLARGSNVSRPTVISHLKQLKRLQLIERVATDDPKGKYFMLVKKHPVNKALQSLFNKILADAASKDLKKLGKK